EAPTVDPVISPSREALLLFDLKPKKSGEKQSKACQHRVSSTQVISIHNSRPLTKCAG
ncbi:unnamed protein product, partial [Musa textilis]